jgi:hypothetical protein
MKLNNLKLNVLVAYPYLNNSLQNYLQDKQDIKLLLDSGAFTAWKAGQTIEVDDYCTFIDSLPFKPWRYFSLDVVGDPDKTNKNYDIMLKRGYKPIPIFTRGEDINVLDEYYKTSDVVGVGGLVGTKKNKAFVNALMKKVQKRKIHWLGFTNLNYIKYYKPYMCDSSSWLTGSRYASFSLYCGNGQFSKINKKDFYNKRDYLNGDESNIKNIIKSYGFNYFDLLKKDGWIGGNSTIRNLCASSYIKLSNDIETNLKTMFFLASSNKSDVQRLYDNYKNLRRIYG